MMSSSPWSIPHSKLLRDLSDYKLPLPVQRFIDHSLGTNKTISSVNLKQEGFLRTSTKSPRWLKFHAHHEVDLNSYSFFWEARIRLAPFIFINVSDSFDNGIGKGQVKLFSRINLSKSQTCKEMNLGSLHRLLAEAAWYPSLLLPYHGVQWTPIDNDRALATLIVKGLSVSLEFRFGPCGEIVGIYTPARWGLFNGKFMECPWEGRFANHFRKDGFLIPEFGEVRWHHSGKWVSVWKGHIRDVDFRLTDLVSR